jgi:hypothetical protein
MISNNDVHSLNPYSPMFSSDEGNSIRQRDVHFQKPSKVNQKKLFHSILIVSVVQPINGQVQSLPHVARIIPRSCHCEDSHNRQKSLPSSVRGSTTARFQGDVGIAGNSSRKFSPSSHREEIISNSEHNWDDRGNSPGRS